MLCLEMLSLYNYVYYNNNLTTNVAKWFRLLPGKLIPKKQFTLRFIQGFKFFITCELGIAPSVVLK